MADKLSSEDLKSIIAAHEKNSLGGWVGDLAIDRQEALKRYDGEPYGDEIEGRSSVISRDFADAVDWIMPSLVRIFLATTDFVKFMPTSYGDADQAKLETEYVNDILLKENNGFLILHDWFKDALMLRNGYVKAIVVDDSKNFKETYKGLTLLEIDQLIEAIQMRGDRYEIIGQDEDVNPDGEPIFDIELRCFRDKTGRFSVEPIPPEEIRIAKNARGQAQHADFVQHHTTKTRSALVEMGLDKDWVDELPLATEADRDESGEKIARDTVGDEDSTGDNSTADKSMDDIDYKESYLRVDWDGDGIAELRKVITVADKLPDKDWANEEIDEIPVYSLSAKRKPHRHVGISLNDDLADLARIKTQLMRLTMDNSYLLTNIEWMVNERCNLADFMVSRPGGLKRIKGQQPVTDAARQVDREPILQHVLPVLDYVDQMKRDRTGIDRNVQGLDPDTLKWTTANAASQALTQANLKIEMIARMFAETGVRDLALGLRNMALKYRNHAHDKMIRGEWQKVNPSTWVQDRMVTVNVGIGTGSTEELRQNLMLMAGLQQQMTQQGIVTPQNAYNLGERLSDNLGFKERNEFFTDPNSPEGKQHMQQLAQAAEKNQLAEVAQVQGEYKKMFEQIKAQSAQQIAAMKAQNDAQIAAQEAKNEAHYKALEQYLEQIKIAVDIFKVEAETGIDAGKKGIGAELPG